MKTAKTRLWFVVHLRCFLIGCLVDSASPSSARSLSVVSTAGNRVVLPCSWKSRLGEEEEAPPTCHVQWVTSADTVLEQKGEEKWEAAAFRGRVAVSEDKLGSGDCSLIISDVQVGDGGRYESFMVLDGSAAKRTRVFIQSVRLSVVDHKSLQSRRPDEDLVLELHTRHSVRVVFQGRNRSEWSDLWMRGDDNSRRLEKDPLLEQLTIRKLKRSDEGTYKVLDEQGLAVSTVQLSVEEKSSTLSFRRTEEKVPTGVAVRSSGSALLLWTLLVSSLQIPLRL